MERFYDPEDREGGTKGRFYNPEDQEGGTSSFVDDPVFISLKCKFNHHYTMQLHLPQCVCPSVHLSDRL